ncbi:MAG: hypothetical protein WEB56_15990 [Roseovarius sp.]
MSAPDTNTEKTKPAHKTPIAGMIAVVVFAIVLLFALVTYLSFAGNDPEGGDPEGVEGTDVGAITDVVSNSLPA